MRTKNGKWIGPVPIALVAVFALAAFLSVGFLLIGNDGQVVEAQDASCEVAVAASDSNGDVPDPTNAQTCMTTDNPASVGLPGSISTESTAATKVWVYAADGSIAGGSSVRIAEPGSTAGTEEAPAALAVTSAIVVDVPAADYNLSTAAAERAMSMINVTPAAGKSVTRLYIYYGSAPSSTAFDHDGDSDADDEARELEVATGLGNTVLTITFLGAPAIGKDADTDANTDVDDETTIQCGATSDSDEPLSEQVGGSCVTPHVQLGTNPDAGVIESRSKLVVHRTAFTASVDQAAAEELIDGSTLDLMMDDQDAVTIHAIIEDAAARALEDVEVSFSATATPSNILSQSALSDTEDTEEWDTSANGIFTVDGITNQEDAVATFTIDDLSDAAEAGAYSVVVEVKVGDLVIGTVNIFKPSAPEEIVAGVFNIECFPGATADTYETVKFNAKAEDCDASGMASRFGAGETFIVKAHLEDSLGNVVGVATDLEAEFADEDDDLLGDEDIVENDEPVAGKTMPRAWFFTVDKDATLGDHMITVSTDEKNDDDEAIDDVTLTVTKAGSPHMIVLSSDDANIRLNGSETFMVTATDMLGGVPHFGAKTEDNMVTISVQPADALVVGTDTSNQVELDADTGVAEFTVYASLDADDGDHGRIIARSGDLEYILPITFGDTTPTTPETQELMEPTGIRVSPFFALVNVEWTPGQGADGHAVLLFNADTFAFVDGEFFGDHTVDEHTFKDVASGDYYVVVASYQNQDDGSRDYAYDGNGTDVTIN